MVELLSDLVLARAIHGLSATSKISCSWCASPVVPRLGRARVRAVALAKQLPSSAAGCEGHCLQLGTCLSKIRSKLGALVVLHRIEVDVSLSKDCFGSLNCSLIKLLKGHHLWKVGIARGL